MIRPVAVASAIVLASLIVSAKAETIAFGGGQPGALPKDFTSALTGSGAVGRWEVVDDGSADGGKALAQLDADKTDYRFPLAILGTSFPRDLDISIRFKAVSGSVDRAGGIAFRLQDPLNYYVVRANALEDNVRLYRVRNGRREELKGANIKVPAGEWQTLAVHAQGNRLAVSFNGKALFDARDETFTTAGKVALWTKADSVTFFDRIEISVLPDRSLPLPESRKP